MTTQTSTKCFAPFALVERHPLFAYFLLAFALFWGWFAPGMTAPIYSIGSFFASSLCFGVLWTWLYRNTHGSVLIAAMFHGAVNLFGNLFYLGIPALLLNWLMPAGYALAALIVIVFYQWSDNKQDF